jgi:cytochrome c-type biogenesis protein
METLFNVLTQALYANMYLSIAAAFAWGILSIILSPCHLGSLPLIIGYITGSSNKSVKSAFLSSLSFSLGILATIVLIGTITGLMGRMLGDIGTYGKYLMAIIFVAMGLYLFDLFQMPSFAISTDKYSGKGIMIGAFLLGLIFGVALGPCSFAYMAPLLAIVFSSGSTNLIFSISLVLAYALGHCSVIVFAGTFSEAVQRYLNWDENSKATSVIKKICGVLIIIAAAYMVLI